MEAPMFTRHLDTRSFETMVSCGRVICCLIISLDFSITVPVIINCAVARTGVSHDRNATRTSIDIWTSSTEPVLPSLSFIHLGSLRRCLSWHGTCSRFGKTEVRLLYNVGTVYMCTADVTLEESFDLQASISQH
jgi:hypothetical protein